MNEQRGIFIGECGHPLPIEASGRITGPCACDRPTASRRRPDCLEQPCTAVEGLARSRYLLGEIIELAEVAPEMTDAELRDQLAGLADGGLRERARAIQALAGPRPPETTALDPHLPETTAQG